MIVADVSFYHLQNASLASLMVQHRQTLGYAMYLKKKATVYIIRHTSQPEQLERDGVYYQSFKGNNNFFYLPVQTLLFLRQLQPDVVLIHGMGFPVQVLLLHALLSKKCRILLQHHGELPMGTLKSKLQKWAVSVAGECIFTASGNTYVWRGKQIINSSTKCYEVPEASTTFKPLNRELCKEKLGFTGEWNFLWVGRLNHNKDPLTVIKGFEQYLQVNKVARLYMVFGANDLLKEIKEYINASHLLKRALVLVGKISHELLEEWYNAADFYLSGSHREAAGFALIEAVACGCIPVVTDIPPFRKLTNDGRVGLLYKPGSPSSLAEQLCNLAVLDRAEMRQRLYLHFQEQLSFKAIAETVYSIIKK